MYKILWQQKPWSATDVTLYTAPTGKSAVISSLTFTNTTQTTDWVKIYVLESWGTIADNRAIVKDYVIQWRNTIALTLWITLWPAESISVYSDQGKVTFMAFWNEI